MKILITGTSGFIGSHVAKALLDRWDEVVWFDNENDYYDVNLKEARRNLLSKYPNFRFYKGSLENIEELGKVFETENPDKVLNLAWQAGVRYSIINPFAYIQSNLVGFHNIIELSKQFWVKNFVYASSSSVYGSNEKQPFSVEDRVDHPVSLYAATKKSNELIAHAYSHLFQLPTIGLRFFTVYGPMGRPDMAYMIFADKITKWEPIDIFGHGNMQRDFTYIDDIVSGVIKCLDAQFTYEIFNLGNDNVEELEHMVDVIEVNLWKKAIKNYKDMQPGDVQSTWADIEYTKQKLSWKPTTNMDEGMGKTMDWYKEYYLNT